MFERIMSLTVYVGMRGGRGEREGVCVGLVYQIVIIKTFSIYHIIIPKYNNEV